MNTSNEVQLEMNLKLCGREYTNLSSIQENIPDGYVKTFIGEFIPKQGYIELKELGDLGE